MSLGMAHNWMRGIGLKKSATLEEQLIFFLTSQVESRNTKEADKELGFRPTEIRLFSFSQPGTEVILYPAMLAVMIQLYKVSLELPGLVALTICSSTS